MLNKILLSVLLVISIPAIAFENAFYILRSDKPVQILATHYTQVQLLIPQAYVINQKGDVTGMINANTFDFAKKHNVKMLAMVTNAGFDKERTHQFLTNAEAQTHAIQTLVLVCQKNQMTGAQFDFEGLPNTDSAALTAFYRKAAAAFHQAKMLISFAVVARADGPLESAFSKKQFTNWSGVYDLKALAEIGDFITLMSYDQHSQGTTPGPTANIQWVESTIKYTLHTVPTNKLSLGIPVYSGYWKTAGVGNSVKVVLAHKSYNDVLAILKKHNINLIWDQQNQLHYAFFTHDWLNEYIFAEDAQSFKAKYDLAKKYNLRGVSIFSMGSEDPEIWKLIPVQKA